MNLSYLCSYRLFLTSSPYAPSSTEDARYREVRGEFAQQ